MQNEHLNEFSKQESLTQIAHYFDIIENSILPGDTNKKYHISPNASRAPSAPYPGGSYTNVIISPTSENICDLFNSYITAKLKLRLKHNIDGSPTIDTGAQANFNCPAYWIGYKSSRQAIRDYQIIANGQAIYTQANGLEESFAMECEVPEAVRAVDVYSTARHEDVWKNIDTIRNGAIVYCKDLKQSNYTIELELKIDLKKFLPLSYIKYLPQFAGNIELKIMFSPDGLVCAPLSVDDIAPLPEQRCKVASKPITNRFVQIGDKFTMIAHNTGTAVDTATLSTEVTSYEVTECFSHLSLFGLDPNVYQDLIARYTNHSLAFPTQTLTFQSMNGVCNTQNSTFTITATPRFVEQIIILFPEKPHHHTCFTNPLIERFTLSMGGYGVMPETSINSWGPAFYALQQNAYNMNNDIAGFNRDVMRSLTANDNVLMPGSVYTTTGHASNDVTNFFMAFPTEVDNTFQQGQTSNSPITYQLKVDMLPTSYFYKSGRNTQPPLLGMRKDSVFAIQLHSDGRPPTIALEEYDVTS